MTSEASEISRVASPQRAGVAGRRDPAIFVQMLMVMWVLLLFEPEWLLSVFGGGPIFKRIPTLLLLPFLLFTAQRWRPEAIYWPFIGFLALHILHMPIVENRGLLMGGFKMLYHFFFIFVGTVCIARSARTVSLLLTLYASSFIWFGLQGFLSGGIFWHSIYSNPDSYGPLMGMGLGYCYYYARAVDSTKMKWMSRAGSTLSLVGVISSLARGAVLSAGLVIFIIWWRSPRKLAALGGGIAAAVIGLAATTVLYPSGTFWEEMSTVTEGTSSGTGQERWVMWNIAIDVFKEYPIIGVGPNNLGPVAYEIIEYDETRARYSDPSNLYSKKTHNIYLQILSETGLVGVALWLWMLIDFYSKARRLRSPAYTSTWNALPGATLDLSMMSRGLECAMVAYLANGFFYNQIYTSWFWILITFAHVLIVIAKPQRGASLRPPQAPESPRRGSGSSDEASKKPTLEAKRGKPAGASLGSGLTGRSGS